MPHLPDGTDCPDATDADPRPFWLPADCEGTPDDIDAAERYGKMCAIAFAAANETRAHAVVDAWRRDFDERNAQPNTMQARRLPLIDAGFFRKNTKAKQRGAPTRLANSLEHAGFANCEQLAIAVVEKQDLKALAGLGDSMLMEVKQTLKRLGLIWRDEAHNCWRLTFSRVA